MDVARNFISFKSNVITLLEYDPKFKPFNKSTDDSMVSLNQVE